MASGGVVEVWMIYAMNDTTKKIREQAFPFADSCCPKSLKI